MAGQKQGHIHWSQPLGGEDGHTGFVPHAATLDHQSLLSLHLVNHQSGNSRAFGSAHVPFHRARALLACPDDLQVGVMEKRVLLHLEKKNG